MKIQWITLFGLLLTGTTYGAIYECQKNGEMVYTNKAGKGCQNAKLSDIGLYSSDNASFAQARRAHASSNNITKTSVSSPNVTARVSSQQQTVRDNGRLSILQRELNNEQQALSTAQRLLAVEKGSNRSALEQEVRDRLDNINALQKEISRM